MERLVVGRMPWPRTFSWSYGSGSHAETAVPALARTWYFAEGATHGGFDLFYLLENPDPVNAADVTVTYLLPAPQAPVSRTYQVAPMTRRTIWVDAEGAPLDATDVSTRRCRSWPSARCTTAVRARPSSRDTTAPA